MLILRYDWTKKWGRFPVLEQRRAEGLRLVVARRGNCGAQEKEPIARIEDNAGVKTERVEGASVSLTTYGGVCTQCRVGTGTTAV